MVVLVVAVLVLLLVVVEVVVVIVVVVVVVVVVSVQMVQCLEVCRVNIQVLSPNSSHTNFCGIRVPLMSLHSRVS